MSKNKGGREIRKPKQPKKPKASVTSGSTSKIESLTNKTK